MKFLYALEIGQDMLAHTTNRVGGPNFFKGEQLKLG